MIETFTRHLRDILETFSRHLAVWTRFRCKCTTKKWYMQIYLIFFNSLYPDLLFFRFCIRTRAILINKIKSVHMHTNLMRNGLFLHFALPICKKCYYWLSGNYKENAKKVYFFYRIIWSVQKKAVPLHPLLRNKCVSIFSRRRVIKIQNLPWRS